MSVKQPIQTVGTARSHFKTLIGLMPMAMIASTAIPAQAASSQPPGHSVNLAWSSIPEIGISGYRIHVGLTSNQYLQTYEAGASNSISINQLEFGQTYYFAVSGLRADGTEGDLSSEIAVTIAPPPLPVGNSISASAGGQRALKWTFPKSAAGSSPDFVIYSSPDLLNWTMAGKVPTSSSTGADAESLEFTWQIQGSGQRMFYKITATNFMGSSTVL